MDACFLAWLVFLRDMCVLFVCIAERKTKILRFPPCTIVIAKPISLIKNIPLISSYQPTSHPISYLALKLSTTPDSSRQSNPIPPFPVTPLPSFFPSFLSYPPHLNSNACIIPLSFRFFPSLLNQDPHPPYLFSQFRNGTLRIFEKNPLHTSVMYV